MKNWLKMALILFCILLTISSASALSVRILKTDPVPAESGKYLTVWIKVDNTGGDTAKDVWIRIVPEYPFSVESGWKTEEDIGHIPANDLAMVDFRLKVDENALEGTNTLKVKYREAIDADWSERDLNIEVESKGVDFEIANIDSIPKRLISDSDDAQLTATIQNIGEGKAEAVKAKLILPDGFEPSESYSDISNIGTIESLGSGTATFYIDIDEYTLPGEHLAKLELSYLQEEAQKNVYRNETLDLLIPVKSTPLFDVVSSETTPPELSTGSENVELKIVIENIGSKKGESVRVKVKEKTEQPFSFEDGASYDYIGDLDAGDIGEAILKFDIDEKDAAVKTYILDIEIRCVEDENVRLFEESVPVKISTKKESTPLPILYVGIVIVALFVLVVYVILPRIRNRKEKTVKPREAPKRRDEDDGGDYLESLKKKKEL
ncbi:MAG: COG1361 S-layer family protein [Methanosarcinales archaeon]|nr:COG1361 S-layer family protein [Methanosarcinales archaeon]